MFEDVRHERSLMSLLSLRDPDVLKQSKFTDEEIILVKKMFETFYRLGILNVAASLLEKETD